LAKSKRRVVQSFMNSEETEWGFANAGWQVPGPTRYPIFCNDAGLPIVTHE
jgi:hypothetical protein